MQIRSIHQYFEAVVVAVSHGDIHTLGEQINVIGHLQHVFLQGVA